MLKARLGSTMAFGLTKENIARLKDGKPIFFDLKDIEGQGKVLIYYTDNEEDLKSELERITGIT